MSRAGQADQSRTLWDETLKRDKINVGQIEGDFYQQRHCTIPSRGFICSTSSGSGRFLIRKGLQPGSERLNREHNLIFFFFFVKNIRHLQNLLMDRKHKQETSNKLRLGIRIASSQLRKRLEHPPIWTNVANKIVGVDHGTFMNVLTGGKGFLNKQKSILYSVD